MATQVAEAGTVLLKNHDDAQVDQHVDATSPPISPAPAVWSAKWTGTLTPSESGLYRFTLAEAGIATLKIAGHTFGPAYREATQFVVGPSYVVQGTMQLIAGQSVPVEIDYSGKSGLFSKEIHFGGQTPSQSGIPATVAAAQKADVAIVFANDAQGEGMDRYSLELQGDQDQLINAVAAANRYPGVNGVENYDEGLDVGYRWYDATGQRPLFPFGYGLSYEQFKVSGARAFYDRFRGTADVVARVRNTSWRPGPTTVELYLESPAGAQEAPKQLKGYTNVTLEPGRVLSSRSA